MIDINKFHKICRVCLNEGTNLKYLFNVGYVNQEQLKLSEIFTACTSIEVLENEDLPKQVCVHCEHSILTTFRFQQQAHQSNALLRTIISQTPQIGLIEVVKPLEDIKEGSLNLSNQFNEIISDNEEEDTTVKDEVDIFVNEIENKDLLDAVIKQEVAADTFISQPMQTQVIDGKPLENFEDSLNSSIQNNEILNNNVLKEEIIIKDEVDIFVDEFDIKEEATEENEVVNFVGENINDSINQDIQNEIATDRISSKNDKGDTTAEIFEAAHCSNKGYHARKTLRRHAKHCYFNMEENATRTNYQSHALNLMADKFAPNDPLQISGVLNSLTADEISLIAKKDKVICEVARQYLKTHMEKHRVQVAKRYMRRLARLLSESRKIENNSKLTLLCILHPSKFKTIVAATRLVAKYNSETKSFSSPTLALQMGGLIKKAISAAHSMEIQRDVNSTKWIFDLMKKLIDEQWASTVSSEAGQNLLVNRSFTKPTLISVTEDVAKMKQYLDNLIICSKAHLEQNQNDSKAFRDLNESTFCSLLLFNKRRVGELQKIQLDIYLKHHEAHSFEEFEKHLTPSERVLVRFLKRIVVRGKRGRGVPVLFDRLTKSGLDLLVDKRKFFFENNEFLFGLPGTNSCISGYQVFRKHVARALKNVNKTFCLSSTRFRNHLATITQILRMEADELEQLAILMGHTEETHNGWYRLPSNIYQTAKISSFLLLAQKNGIDEYKKCKLNDIEFSDEIIDQNSDSDSEADEYNESHNFIENMDVCESSEGLNTKRKEEGTSGTVSQAAKRRKGRN